MYKIARLLFVLSSMLKAAGKLILPQGILCDCLSLPGWFIIDGMIIHQTPITGNLVGFQWDYWPMPEIELKKLKRKTCGKISE